MGNPFVDVLYPGRGLLTFWMPWATGTQTVTIFPLVTDHPMGGGLKCTTAPPKRGTQLLWARGKGAVQFICPGRQRGVVKMNCGGAVGTR